MTMTSSRPYIIRALYEWILENECTPYVLVNALGDQVEVPQQYVKNGQIVLNVSPVAVMDLQFTNEAMFFNGRFGGVPQDIYVPMSAVMGIYARENGQGMIFEMDEDPAPEPTPPNGPSSGKATKEHKPVSSKAASERLKKPGLRVVK